MNVWRWFRVCCKTGHEFSAWKQVEALPVPFLCCRICSKDAPEEQQREFFLAYITGGER